MVAAISDEKTIQILQDYYDDSNDSEKRQERVKLSIANNNAFNGRFDFSNKVDGQSTESLPKVTTAVESLAAYIRRGLTSMGDWYRIEMREDDVLTEADVSAILWEMMHRMPDVSGGDKNIEQALSDGAKCGALDSLVVFKIHGTTKKARVPPGLVGINAPEIWWLSIDVVPFEDYFPDPTGRKLYEIHQKKVDLYMVQKMAKAGVYDKGAVGMIQMRGGASEGADQESEKDELDRDDSKTNTKNTTRAHVVVREFYGTMVDDDGKLLGENMRATTANENIVVQSPREIQEWCGSPFATGPLTRVPHTVWHRAPMDHASDLNQAINELYNLIFDAGISAVHGVKEARIDWLEDPDSISGGIAPQQTIAINSTAPAGASAITVTKTGMIPAEVLALLSLAEKEFLEAAMTNEIRVGSLPEKQVLATEIITSESSNAVLLDAVLGEYEHVISSALTKAWQLIVQNMPDISSSLMLRAVGENKAIRLARMSDEDRFRRYVADTKVIVSGLSGLRARAEDLRKLVAVLATAREDPLLLQEYGRRISANKLFERLFSMAGLDIRDVERTKEELEAIKMASGEAQVASGNALGPEAMMGQGPQLGQQLGPQIGGNGA